MRWREGVAYFAGVVILIVAVSRFRRAGEAEKVARRQAEDLFRKTRDLEKKLQEIRRTEEAAKTVEVPSPAPDAAARLASSAEREVPAIGEKADTRVMSGDDGIGEKLALIGVDPAEARFSTIRGILAQEREKFNMSGEVLAGLSAVESRRAERRESIARVLLQVRNLLTHEEYGKLERRLREEAAVSGAMERQFCRLRQVNEETPSSARQMFDEQRIPAVRDIVGEEDKLFGERRNALSPLVVPSAVESVLAEYRDSSARILSRVRPFLTDEEYRQLEYTRKMKGVALEASVRLEYQARCEYSE